MKRVRQLAAITLLTAWIGAAAADTVIYKTDARGTTDSIEAEATRDANGWLLRIPSDQGAIEMRLDADQVVEVIGATAPVPREDLDTQIRDNPRAAIDAIFGRWRAGAGSRDALARDFQRAVDAYLAQAEGQRRSGAYKQALAMLKDAREVIDSINGRAILAAARARGSYVDRVEEATRLTQRDYAHHLAKSANEILDRADPARYSQDTLADLQKAVQYDETNALAWLGLAKYYYRPNNPDTHMNIQAMHAAETAKRYTLNDAIRRQAEAIHQSAMVANQQPAAGTVSPAAPQPSGNPAGPSGTGGAPVAASAARGSIVDLILAGEWEAALDEILQSEFLPIGIGVVAFLVVFWFLPAKILRWRARKGSIPASIWHPRVKYLGIFALLAYLGASVRMPRKARDRCPICKKPIDNIDDYGDFNFYVCPHCGENITPVYNLDDYVQHLVQQVEREVRRRRGHYSESTIEKDATLKLVRAVITQAVRQRASDLHIDSGGDGANVRFRIDGVLYDRLFLPRSTVPSTVSSIKVMANLDIAERRVPQDGKFSIWVDKADIDARVNTSPAVHGEKVSMRLLDERTINIPPAELGFQGQSLGFFEQAIRRPHGLLIVTGPSGSGKSTTLYVALNAINTGDKNIITLEDPIEYEQKGLNQMQVNPAANFTFATGLRSIVRQDPDVIMVGEVRDKETAEMAIEAAITGHLVMTTMHTIDTTTVFTRLVDMGIDTRRYASAIIVLIAQRLVRLNCPECKRRYQPEQKHLVTLRLDQSKKDIVYLKGEGCPHCQQTGYFGRSGLFEVLAPDRQIRALLEQNAAASKIREMARRKGMRNIREEGIVKIMRGLTTVEDVIRATM